MKKRSCFFALLCASVLLSGCSNGQGETGDAPAGEEVSVRDEDRENSGGSGVVGTLTVIEDNGDEAQDGQAAGGSGSYGEDEDMNEATDLKSVPGSSGVNIAKGAELMCLADNEQEAEKIAAQYGIKLESFANGVATFSTSEDPQAVIQRGKENGYPELDINQVIQLDDPVLKPGNPLDSVNGLDQY